MNETLELINNDGTAEAYRFLSSNLKKIREIYYVKKTL
jgi:hypothetical protein